MLIEDKVLENFTKKESMPNFYTCKLFEQACNHFCKSENNDYTKDTLSTDIYFSSYHDSDDVDTSLLSYLCKGVHLSYEVYSQFVRFHFHLDELKEEPLKLRMKNQK